MTFSTMTRFFASLALATDALVIAMVVVALAGALSPALADTRARLAVQVRDSALPLAWLIATVAMLGSLYYSEVAHLVPCRFCWFQRIAMYPLAVVLGIAALRRDRDVWWYVLPVAGIGALLAGYHYTMEWMPSLGGGACATDVPCNVALFRAFGFISLPYMALSAFLAIVALMLVARSSPHDTEDAVDV